MSVSENWTWCVMENSRGTGAPGLGTRFRPQKRTLRRCRHRRARLFNRDRLGQRDHLPPRPEDVVHLGPKDVADQQVYQVFLKLRMTAHELPEREAARVEGVDELADGVV